MRTKDGEPEIVLIHIEPQRTRRKNFAGRMFEYHALGIPDLVEADYAGSDNSAISAFRALMREHKWYRREKPRDRVARVMGLLTAPAALRIDDNRRTYLIAFVDKYLPLTRSERRELERRLKGTGEEVVEQIMTYYQREGYEKGKAEGLQIAAPQLLTDKFGHRLPSARERVEGMRSADELTILLSRISSAVTLNDLGLAPA